jgi:hypothetical protein
MASLTADQYEERRIFLEELKTLTKTEQEKIFVILRNGKAEFSENSNGIFFDVAALQPAVFAELKAYMEYCRTVRKDQAAREREMEELR